MERIIQQFILSSTDISNGYVGPLTYTADSLTLEVQIRGSFTQFRQDDFTLFNNSIYWSTDLANILVENDILIIEYLYDTGDTGLEHRQSSYIKTLTTTDISNGYVLKSAIEEGVEIPLRMGIRHSPTLARLPDELSASFRTNFTSFDYSYGIDNDINLLTANWPLAPTSYMPTVTSGNSFLVFWKESSINTSLSAGDILEVFYTPSTREFVTRELFSITSDQIQNNKIILSDNIKEVVKILIRDAPLTQIENIDYNYTVFDSVIYFNDLSRSVTVGDKIEVVYYVSSFNVPTLIKKNEDYSYSNKIKEWSANPKWVDEYPNVWSFFTASQDNVFSRIREKTTNFVMNTRDPMKANIRALDSLAMEVDFPVSNILPLEKLPPDLERMVDIFSVNRSEVLDQINPFLASSTLSAIFYDDLVTSAYSFASQPISGTYYPLEPGRFINTIETSALFYPTVNFIFNPSAYMKNEFAPTGDLTTWTLTSNLINTTSASIIFEDDSYLSFMRKCFITHLIDKLKYIENDVDLSIDYSLSPSKLNEQNQLEEAYEYVQFLDTIWPCSGFCYKLAFSGDIIDAASYLLMDACLRYSYKRENIRLAGQRYNIAGSNIGAERLVYEELLKNFTKPSCWRLVSPDSDSLTAGILDQQDTCIASTSAEAIGELFMPDFCGASGLNINVIEYYDKTDYLNISAYNTDGRSGGANRFWETLSPSANSDYDLLGLTGSGPTVITGKLYFSTYPTSAEVLSSFFSEYAISSEDFIVPSGMSIKSIDDVVYEASAFISGTLLGSFGRDFLPAIWNTFATSGLSGTPSDLPDLKTIVDPVKSVVNMVSATIKYFGGTSGALPAQNYRNAQFPTVAPIPSLHNLTEKIDYTNTVPLAETILPSESLKIQLIEEDVSEAGIPLRSWKTGNQELVGYQTGFEQSYNLDYNQVLNEAIDRDGPFYQPALRQMLRLHSINQLTTPWTSLSSFYRPVFGWMDERMRNQYLQATQRKLDFWTTDILNLSGDDWKSITNNIDYSTESFIELTGQRLTTLGVDSFDNQWCLYKGVGSDGLEAPSGKVFIRRRNEPFPFPAASPWLPIDIELSASMIQDVIDQYQLADGYDIVSGQSNSGIISFYKDGNPIDEEVLEYFPYKGYCRIADWRNTNLFVKAAAGHEGLDEALNNCYHLGVHDDVVHLVGKRKYDDALSGMVEQDVLFIFGIEDSEVPPGTIDGFSSCCNTQYSSSSPLRILATSVEQDRILRTVVLGTSALIVDRYVSYNGEVVAHGGVPVVFT